jgi:hypothetical protein
MRIKEALSIAGAIFVGFLIVGAIGMATSLLADKVFSDHLWIRRSFAALIVLALAYFLFPKRRKVSSD